MGRLGKYQYKNRIIKQLHLNKEKQKKNNAQISIGGVIILIVVIIVIIAMMWFLLLPPSCGEQDQVELTGILYGFERNNSHWDVKLGNTTYIFQHFDKSYMEKMLGYDITITVCDRGKHYDFLTAYVVNEEMD